MRKEDKREGCFRIYEKKGFKKERMTGSFQWSLDLKSLEVEGLAVTFGKRNVFGRS